MSTEPVNVADSRLGAKFVVPILLGPTLNGLNTTMISVALVPIANALHLPSSTVIWLVVSLYVVTAISQPTMGALADLFGPRKIYVSGFVIVIIASILPFAFVSFGGVLAARILLGLGISAGYPAALTLIRQRTTALSIPTPPALLAGLSMATLATAAVGPVLGGFLIQAFGWNAIFAVNIPIAAVTLVLTLLWLPSDRDRITTGTPQRLTDALDFTGIALFAGTVAAGLFFVLEIDQRLWWLLIAFAALLITLVFWSLRRTKPFLDVRLLVSNGALTRTYLRLFLVFLGPYIVVYAISQWLQDDFGLSSGNAGLVQLPSALLAGIASILIARTTKVRKPLVLAAVIPIAGGLLLVVLTHTSPLWVVIIAASIFGIPQGLGAVSNQVVLYKQAPQDQIGSASGLSNTAVAISAIMASSLIGVVFGNAPSDAGVHTLGWIVLGAGVVVTLLTILDRSLTRAIKL
jgi:MFS family permease